jgi:very-short-patch-repair endonuclease
LLRTISSGRPAELVVERAGLLYTAPPLSAIDLATFDCADAIDIALRTRAATLEGMYQALRLTPNRLGNQQRLKLLIDSRNEPGSAAERLAHRILRGAGLTGWRTNFPVVLEGRIYYIDIAFPHLKLAIEIDGLHEDDEDLFESDRWRQNALVANGWLVLRFTWRMLRDHPDRRCRNPSGIDLQKSDAGLSLSARHAVGSESSVRK